MADLDATTCVLPAPLHRTQQFTGGTTISIGCFVIAEMLEAEAALLLDLAVALRRRHIGNDAIVLARLQFSTAVIAGIGQHLQALGFKSLGCRFCHRMKLVYVTAIVYHLAGDDGRDWVSDRGWRAPCCTGVERTRRFRFMSCEGYVVCR